MLESNGISLRDLRADPTICNTGLINVFVRKFREQHAGGKPYALLLSEILAAPSRDPHIEKARLAAFHQVITARVA